MTTTMMKDGRGKADVDALLDVARPFLRGELGQVDPALPSLVSVLCAAGAGECYHKHGSFLAHLLGVYRVLKLWGAPDALARCGLFHSAYSNSYVNLAIFRPDTGRDQVRAVVGAAAERLVHLFCVVPRHRLIHDDLLAHYTDQELGDHLEASQQQLQAPAAPSCWQWQAKLRAVVPPEGLVVEHIRTGEAVRLPRRVVAAFLLMTVADFSEQYTDYQDQLFGNQEDGRLEFRGDNWGALWPGTGKPGLWVSSMSRMAALYHLIARDDKLLSLSRLSNNNSSKQEDADDDMATGIDELVIPPVFDGCTKVLDAQEQKAARDLYWEAITMCGGGGGEGQTTKTTAMEEVEGLLRQSISKNPFVGEPHLVLAQVLLGAARFGDAEEHAQAGLRLLLGWGSSWDKRMSWEGWVSWARLMRDKARRREWPRTAWGIINLGLVQGVANYN